MIISYVGVLANIPANYGFIYVFELGLFGAGLASVASQTLTLLVALVYWRVSPTMAPYRASTRVSRAKVAAQAKESAPICIGYAGEGGAYAMIGVMMGWVSATALAAHQVVNAAGGLAYVVPLGLAGAVSIRVGQARGQGRSDRLRPILTSGLGISVVWQTVIAVMFIAFGTMMAASLSDDPAVVMLAGVLFIMVALLQVADGIQGTALGALRGLSDNVVPSAITLAAYWPLALPLAYLLAFPLSLGAVGLWLGYTMGLVVAAIALPWRYWRMTAGDLKSQP